MPYLLLNILKRLHCQLLKTLRKITRVRAHVLNIKPKSLLTIRRKDLKLVPHKCHTVQQLSNTDKTARLEMCQQFRQEIENDNDWIKNVWFTDEAHFYLNEIVNSQNCRLWGKDVPNKVNERPPHSDKYTAWCALSANGIIGPL